MAVEEVFISRKSCKNYFKKIQLKVQNFIPSFIFSKAGVLVKPIFPLFPPHLPLFFGVNVKKFALGISSV